MNAFVRGLTLAVVAAAGLSGGLSAQVFGMPVRNAGVGTGIGIAGDVGFPNGDAGKGIAFAATGMVGLGPLGVTGSVGSFNPKGPGSSLSSVGVTGNLKIFGGPLVPLSVTAQAGAAYGKADDVKYLHVPVGIGVALTIPNPVFSIKPWIAPRLDVVRTTVPALTLTSLSGGGGSSTDKNFGISGGVDLGFLSGLSIRVMYDRVSADDGVHPGVFSVGAGFKVGK